MLKIAIVGDSEAGKEALKKLEEKGHAVIIVGYSSEVNPEHFDVIITDEEQHLKPFVLKTRTLEDLIPPIKTLEHLKEKGSKYHK